jgi:hypothetical protein
VVGTALPSILMLWRYTASSGLTVFTYLVDLTVVTVAIPYFFSAIASSPTSCRAVAFAGGYQVVYQALIVILVGLILYAFLNARRQRLGEAREPVDLPEGGQPAMPEVAGTAGLGNGNGPGNLGAAPDPADPLMTRPRPIPRKETPPL